MKAKDLRTLEQNAELHRLITLLNIDKDTKREMVETYTRGRETSSAFLSHMECQEMINFLRSKKPGDDVQTPENKMRRKIISIAYDLGWSVYNAKQRRMVADMTSINSWCKKFGMFHKELNQHKHDELVKLVTQFEKLQP